MDFKPFTNSFAFDPDVLIEDFPDYLLPHIERWVRNVMSTSHIVIRANISSDFKRDLEFRIRRIVPNQVGSFIDSWTSNPGGDLRLADTYVAELCERYASYRVSRLIKGKFVSIYGRADK